MKSLLLLFSIATFVSLMTWVSLTGSAQQNSRWTVEKANEWYARQGWLVGANYLPVSAINQLEMFQAETFDTATIHRELELARRIGFNTMRVYLHDKLWSSDAEGFKRRFDTFLRICSAYGIRPMIVFFDSCWDPFPKEGKQHEPIEGLHNSGWVQSPGADMLRDSTQWPLLERYVRDMTRTFGRDQRILCWDVWNEPDNLNTNSYGKLELMNKVSYVEQLLPRVFHWVRSENPIQPLTSGLWTPARGGWHKDSASRRNRTEAIQLELSDIISFHYYNKPQEFERRAQQLITHGRPLICTEYMARGQNNTILTILPIGKKYNIGMINWGFADGREQTKYPWDSWEKRYTGDPPLWHHVLFRKDYSPYIPGEIALISELTAN